MNAFISQGTKRIIDGVERVFYDGYWIKSYVAPADSLRAKKRLIEALTRRLFNHVEHGLNVPGQRLGEARRSWETEADPERRRVKGAMLAGALFNRATDIFTKLVELQAVGVEIDYDNGLMRECGACLKEALELGKTVLHRSGDEGIDELWGEPFKAFSIPVEAFYESRYIKIAQTMHAIDRLVAVLDKTFAKRPGYAALPPLVHAFAEAAKVKCETLRTDADIFDVWSSFAVAGEKLHAFAPELRSKASDTEALETEHAQRLVLQARNLVSYMARARVPMPKSTTEFEMRCALWSQRYPATALAA
jgi:hypothetical protein